MATDLTRYWSGRWQRLRLRYQTLRDSTLQHQLILYTNFDKDFAAWGEVHVSCNCVAIHMEGKGGPIKHVSFGKTLDLTDTKRLFNDPSNHLAHFDPERDGLKW